MHVVCTFASTTQSSGRIVDDTRTCTSNQRTNWYPEESPTTNNDPKLAAIIYQIKPDRALLLHKGFVDTHIKLILDSVSWAIVPDCDTEPLIIAKNEGLPVDTVKAACFPHVEYFALEVPEKGTRSTVETQQGP